jgi:hypothetical protein
MGEGSVLKSFYLNKEPYYQPVGEEIGISSEAAADYRRLP